jgi:hypothetical protein
MQFLQNLPSTGEQLPRLSESSLGVSEKGRSENYYMFLIPERKTLLKKMERKEDVNIICEEKEDEQDDYSYRRKRMNSFHSLKSVKREALKERGISDAYLGNGYHESVCRLCDNVEVREDISNPTHLIHYDTFIRSQNTHTNNNNSSSSSESNVVTINLRQQPMPFQQILWTH